MSRGETVKRGYLTKSPPESKAKVAQWHKRWFVLMDSRLVYPLADRYVRLEYYQSEAEALRLADPKGMINLKDCDKVCSREPIKGHKYVFDICTEDRTYHLAAETPEEKHDWIRTLNTLLFTEQNVNRQRRWSPPQQRVDIAMRTRLESSGRTQRPLSYTGSPTVTHSPRPLPPVPPASSPVSHRHRPLPPPPTSATPSHSSPQNVKKSPRLKQKREPPVKPPPYKKSSTGTTPQSVDISCHYEVAPGQQPKVPSRKRWTERAGGQTRSMDESILFPKTAPTDTNSGNDDQEYSVLQESRVIGYDPSNQDYSHLELNGTTVHSTPNPKLSHKKNSVTRDYENMPHLPAPDNEEYSHLKY